MKLERAILLTFLGNYLINNVVAAIAAFFPATPASTSGNASWPWPPSVQMIAFVLIAAVLVALLAWWYLKTFSSNMTMKAGLVFGITGFIVSIATAFITGVSGVLIQTTSFSTLMKVLPNFGPFLTSESTLYLLIYWIVPAILIGWWLGRGTAMSSPRPMQPGMSMNQSPNTM